MTLALSNLIGFGVNASEAAPPVITYIGRYLITNNQNDYGWNDVGIGVASADRLVVIVAMAYTSASTPFGVRHADSGTAAAGAFMQVVPNTMQNASAMWNEMYYESIPAGATHSFYIDGNGAMNHGSIAIYTITGLLSHTPESGVSDNGVGSTLPLTHSADAAVIAAGCIPSATTATWDGVTEEYDLQSESLSFSGGSAIVATPNSTVDPNFVVETNLQVMAGAWR